ncbi:P-loop containing nucleoside triphosphate hydrolase protein [Phakopsora pachyrhizi]|uniref:P-loop containing nucleoside triphosphate hydrolase protein n=1 Tax=Phakopsora pachyrhizi TaxID=170000 RepID=A0AAV0BME3_PHAPC|nr:P-loop containing nucleoside triphosphate hydrolase protein [Phakopsora pachyrhizi]CAH7687660.1 P-loop containing nucleoside triphosphate hydrolase protein [Phakopsora pachyrhizi]
MEESHISSGSGQSSSAETQSDSSESSDKNERISTSRSPTSTPVKLEAEENKEKIEKTTTFEDLGLIKPLCEACSALNFLKPTPIQVESIPYALSNRDIIGLAQTGSGKTAAFALPVLQALWEDPKPFYACVLAPTRELAYQISQQFEALGSTIGVKTTVIVGGMDMMSQAISLSKRPHIIVATPGRLHDHLEHTKGFSLRNLRFLIMDEADRLLDMDFGPVIDKILKVIPRDRRTFLFSATMTTKVAKLQRASLVSPVKVQVSTKYDTVDALVQSYMFFPFKYKDVYLVYLINELSGKSIIVFTRTVYDASRLSAVLRMLGFPSIPLHGQLSQSVRLSSLNQFKSGNRSILVATDVASRGLDIPAVDCVVNYDLPTNSKDYIHRVGRTARAGRSGKAVTLATQYDVELLQRIEGVIGKKMTEFPHEREQVLILAERVGEASREAVRELREAERNRGKGGKHHRKRRGGGDGEDEDYKDCDDDVVQGGTIFKKKKKYK